MMNDAVRTAVDDLARIKESIAKLNEQKARAEAIILGQAEIDLKDTKIKTVHYPGCHGNRVTATRSATVKVVYPTYLKRIFGTAYPDVVKEEVTHKLTEPAKRMLAGIYLRDYTDLSVEEILSGLEIGPEEKAILQKRIKGQRFATDKKNLMAIGNLEEPDAELVAYFAAESTVWRDFLRLLAANGTDARAEIDRCIEMVDGAVVVEEGTKITVEAAE